MKERRVIVETVCFSLSVRTKKDEMLMICLHARMWRWRIKTRAWLMDFAKPQPECLRSASVSVIFAVVRPKHVIELRLRRSQEDQPMHASQHCITLRDPLVVLISSGGFESRAFRDRCRVAVGLIVPRSQTRRHHALSQPNCATHPGYG